MPKNLKPVDKAAYAICRTYLAAGSEVWAAWKAKGEGPWPNTDSTVSSERMLATLLQYIPAMSISYAGDDNCPSEDERTADAACFALAYSNVFSPPNVQAMIAALDARTPPDVLDSFGAVPAGADLEWWAVALTSGVLIAIGGLPFAGALVFKIAGYLFASWALYKFVTPSTPGGQSIFETWKDKVSEGFDTLVKSATGLAGLVIGGLLVYWLATK